LNNINRTVRIIAAGILSLAALCAVQLWSSGAAPRCADTMVRAGEIMERAILAIRDRRAQAGAGFDLGIDPNRTGLIGPEYTPLTTTAGELEAKRSTTNPNVAGLIVYLLCKAGVKPGDSVAIGSSGSFPALLVASLAATRAMDVHPVTILSLGASSYGSTDPDFSLLDIYDILASKGISSAVPAAASLGGEKDVGLDFDSKIRDRLIDRIQAGGVPFLHEPDLVKNVSERLRIYERAAPQRIAAFINSGGGYANLGTSRLALDVRPGLNTDLSLPPPTERGVLFEMAAREVPVIHLLFIKGLVTEAGLPWDPIPLPKPAPLSMPGAERGSGFWLVTAAYFALLFLLAAYPRQNT
jgi:poly-gamma-glutamate system protein